MTTQLYFKCLIWRSSYLERKMMSQVGRSFDLMASSIIQPQLLTISDHLKGKLMAIVVSQS